MLIYWSSSSPHHTLSIYLLFFWLKSWAFNWVVTWDVFISAHSEFISLFSFRCCAALNFSMNDERTISNDNFFFRVLRTLTAAHHNYNFSFPWRSIDHMISFFSNHSWSYFIKYFLPAAIVTLLFFASHEEISKHFFNKVSRGNSNHLAFCWCSFFLLGFVFERGSLHDDKKKNKHFHGEIFIHPKKAIFFLKL